MILLPFFLFGLGIAGFIFVNTRKFNRRNSNGIEGFASYGNMVGERALDGLLTLGSLGLFVLSVMAFLAIGKSETSNISPPSTISDSFTPSGLPSTASNSSASAYQLADSHLNRAYNALKSRLSISGRNALTYEQRRWLQQRDRIRSVEERTRFVEQRAQELDRRTQ